MRQKNHDTKCASPENESQQTPQIQITAKFLCSILNNNNKNRTSIPYMETHKQGNKETSNNQRQKKK